MRFHLVGDYRFPPNATHVFDSYNSKLFRFVDLFKDKHIIYVYGPSGCELYFEHDNIKYQTIIDGALYNEVDILDPDLMLTDKVPDGSLKKIRDKFNKNAVRCINNNYVVGDIVVTTVSLNGLREDIIYVNYSVGCFYTHAPYASCETEFIRGKLKNTRISQVITPYFRKEDFPLVDVQREINTFLFLGRCSFQKGLARFMLIADYYNNKKLPGKFIVAGPMNNSNIRPNSIQMSYGNNSYYNYDLNLFPNVKYVGIVDSKERNVLLRRATCLIQLSQYEEPCGYNAIEAQYCGCPVIANNNGGFQETVVHERTGYLTNDYQNPWKLDWTIVQETINCMQSISSYEIQRSCIHSEIFDHSYDSLECTNNVSKYFDKDRIYEETLDFFTKCISDYESGFKESALDATELHLIAGLRTIHTNLILSSSAVSLLKTLYNDILHYDDRFHYFWEPYLIIRVSTNSETKITKWLKKRDITYYVYNYPIDEDPALPPNIIYHREQPGIVMNNLRMFIKLFHLNSVSGILLPLDQQQMYRERAIHTLYNSHHILGQGESNELRSLANSRDQYNKRINLQ